MPELEEPPIILGEPFDTYVRLGWRIFPLHGVVNGKCTCGNKECTSDVPNSSAGKHPILNGWQKNASNDPKVISEWIKKYPNANWGLPTGTANNLLVVDIDPPKGGEDSLIQLEQKIGISIRETTTNLTGSGGQHYLFQTDEIFHGGANVQGFAGVDIRAEGNYIAVPPSLHKIGRQYEWEIEHDPAENLPTSLPNELKNWLTASSATVNRSTENELFYEDEWEPVPENIAKRIYAVCPWLDETKKRQIAGETRVVSYDDWIAAASWFRGLTPDSSDLFHEWSKLDTEPGRYSYPKTEKHWNSLKNHTPYSCEKMSPGKAECQRCELRGKIKNPVNYLRRMYAEELGIGGIFGIPSNIAALKRVLETEGVEWLENQEHRFFVSNKILNFERTEFNDLLLALVAEGKEDVCERLTDIRDRFDQKIETKEDKKAAEDKKKMNQAEMILDEFLESYTRGEAPFENVMGDAIVSALAFIKLHHDEVHFTRYLSEFKRMLTKNKISTKEFDKTIIKKTEELKKQERLEQRKADFFVADRSELLFGVKLPKGYCFDEFDQLVYVSVNAEGAEEQKIISRQAIAVTKYLMPFEPWSKAAAMVQIDFFNGHGKKSGHYALSRILDYRGFIKLVDDGLPITTDNANDLMQFLSKSADYLQRMYWDNSDVYQRYVPHHGWIHDSNIWIYHTGQKLFGTGDDREGVNLIYAESTAAGDGNVARALQTRRGSERAQATNIWRDLTGDEPEITSVVAFAAGSPLVLPLSESRSFELRGFIVEFVSSEGGTGKSTAETMGNSLFGSTALHQNLQVSSLTSAALAQMFYASGGIPIFYEEPQSSGGSADRGRKNVIDMRELLFNLSLGIDKRRGTAEGRNRDSVYYSGILIVAANETYSDLAKGEPGDGELARLVSLAPNPEQNSGRALKLGNMKKRWTDNDGKLHDRMGEVYYQLANNLDELKRLHKKFTDLFYARVEELAGDQWDPVRMGTLRRYATLIAVGILGAYVLEESADGLIDLSQLAAEGVITAEEAEIEKYMPSGKFSLKGKITKVVLEHMAITIWNQIKSGDRFKKASTRAAEFLDEVIESRGEKEIRPFGVNDTMPPNNGWLGFWLDDEMTKVAFYPSRFDELLKSKSFGAAAIRKSLAQEGKIMRAGENITMTKYDPGTKKATRVVIYTYRE